MNKPKRLKSKKSEIDQLVRENVAAVKRIEKAELKSRSSTEVMADTIAEICGSLPFVCVQCFLFTAWIVWNGSSLVSKEMQVDQPPFFYLSLAVALEAIFLSTFILARQNHLQRAADHREHLDLQINMLAEQENSQMLTMLRQIMEHLDISSTVDGEHALEKATDLERVAEQIQEHMASETLDVE